MAYSEPGTVLFQGLRNRLTLWYCGVLGVALVLFGIVLYLGAQYFLLTPIEYDATQHAYGHTAQWLRESPYHACPMQNPGGRGNGPDGPPGMRFTVAEMFICYDQNGSLLTNQDTRGLSPAFLSNTLAMKALQTGQPQHDTVDGGANAGQTYVYTVVVSDPNSNEILGVIQIGESIQVQQNVLSLLLMLLLSIGALALLGAGAGGLFLANRALVPARLAWTRQQRFIADASHELRTPLTLMRADAEVLLRGRAQQTAEDAALLEDIVSEVNHMTHLVNNMLTLARLDTHTTHQEHEVVDLAEVARTGARRIQALAEQTGITIQVEANERAMVIGDPTMLEQATLALLDNAIKYNRRGGHITVRTTLKNDRVLLEVSDTGIGISAEHLSRLGERFYRVDKARSRQAGGTGLGLSIVQSIASAHDGTLTLSSVPEQSTTATLTLPLAHGTQSDRLRQAPPDNASSLSQKMA
jgi:signal transduction histidine kinase